MSNLPEVRCPYCDNLHFKGTIDNGCIEMLCRKCKVKSFLGNGISFTYAVDHVDYKMFKPQEVLLKDINLKCVKI